MKPPANAFRSDEARRRPYFLLGVHGKRCFPHMSKYLLSGDNLEQFPTLCGFLIGHFHQDWDIEFDSAETAIEDFLDNADARVIDATCGEIESVLGYIEAGAFHRHLLVALGCSYDPQLKGLTQVEWLRSLLDQFRTHLSRRR